MPFDKPTDSQDDFQEVDVNQETYVSPQIRPQDIPHRQKLKCYIKRVLQKGHILRIEVIVYEPEEFRGFTWRYKDFNLDKAEWAFDDFKRKLGSTAPRFTWKDIYGKPLIGFWCWTIKSAEKLLASVEFMNKKYSPDVPHTIATLPDSNKHWFNFGEIVTEKTEPTEVSEYAEFMVWEDAPKFEDTELAVRAVSPQTEGAGIDLESKPPF